MERHSTHFGWLQEKWHVMVPDRSSTWQMCILCAPDISWWFLSITGALKVGAGGSCLFSNVWVFFFG